MYPSLDLQRLVVLDQVRILVADKTEPDPGIVQYYVYPENRQGIRKTGKSFFLGYSGIPVSSSDYVEFNIGNMYKSTDVSEDWEIDFFKSEGSANESVFRWNKTVRPIGAGYMDLRWTFSFPIPYLTSFDRGDSVYLTLYFNVSSSPFSSETPVYEVDVSQFMGGVVSLISKSVLGTYRTLYMVLWGWLKPVDLGKIQVRVNAGCDDAWARKATPPLRIPCTIGMTLAYTQPLAVPNIGKWGEAPARLCEPSAPPQEDLESLPSSSLDGIDDISSAYEALDLNSAQS